MLVDRFNVKFWNDVYYCKVQMPNGQVVELKSRDDLTYRQWQEKISEAWDSIQNPEPEPNECQCPKCRATFVCENRR
jgi:hypothetical protein